MPELQVKNDKYDKTIIRMPSNAHKANFLDTQQH